MRRKRFLFWRPRILGHALERLTAGRSVSLSRWLPCLEVIGIARLHEVKETANGAECFRAVMVHLALVIVNQDGAATDDLELVPLNADRGIFIDANPQHVGMSLNNAE